MGFYLGRCVSPKYPVRLEAKLSYQKLKEFIECYGLVEYHGNAIGDVAGRRRMFFVFVSLFVCRFITLLNGPVCDTAVLSR